MTIAPGCCGKKKVSRFLDSDHDDKCWFETISEFRYLFDRIWSILVCAQPLRI